MLRFLAGRLLGRTWQTLVFEMTVSGDPIRGVWHDHEILIVYTSDDPPLPSEFEQVIRRHEDGLPEIVKAGNWLYVVLSENRCVHFGAVVFDSRHVRMLGEPKGTPLISNCFTVPEARGKALYRRSLAEIASRIQAAGHPRIVIETFPENISSRRGIEGAGFRLLHVVKAIIFFSAFAVGVLERDGQRRIRIWRF